MWKDNLSSDFIPTYKSREYERLLEPDESEEFGLDRKNKDE